MRSYWLLALVSLFAGTGCVHALRSGAHSFDVSDQKDESGDGDSVATHGLRKTLIDSKYRVVLPAPVEFSVEQLERLAGRVTSPADVDSIPKWKLEMLDAVGDRMRKNKAHPMPLSEEMTGAEYLLALLAMTRGQVTRAPDPMSALVFYMSSPDFGEEDLRAVYCITEIAHNSGANADEIARAGAIFYLSRATGRSREEVMQSMVPEAPIGVLNGIVNDAPSIETLNSAEWRGEAGWRKSLDVENADLPSCATLSATDQAAIQQRTAKAGLYQSHEHGLSVRFPAKWLQKSGTTPEAIIKASDPDTSMGIAFFVVASGPLIKGVVGHSVAPDSAFTALNEISAGTRLGILESGRIQIDCRDASWMRGSIESPFGRLNSLQYLLIDGKRMLWLYGITDRSGDALNSVLSAFRSIADSLNLK